MQYQHIMNCISLKYNNCKLGADQFKTRFAIVYIFQVPFFVSKVQQYNHDDAMRRYCDQNYCKNQHYIRDTNRCRLYLF